MKDVDITKCIICDKAMFCEVGKTPICPECEQGEGQLFKDIRNLLRDYPDRKVTIKDAAQIFKVDEKRVEALVRKGLLHLADEK